MKSRVLLAGKNENIKDELFENMCEEYELMSTSDRYRDMDSHLHSFGPDYYIYCISDETEKQLKDIAAMHSNISEAGARIIVTGEKKNCDFFQQVTSNMAELSIDSEMQPDIAKAVDEYIESRPKAMTEEVKKKHVLVIDDDPQMLRVIKEMLHDRYDVATAISGRIAYKFLEKKTTDLILLDFEMPEENGPQVLSHIRENDQYAEIPVFFLTGNTEREKIKEAMSLNPQGYLVKPIDRDSLVDSIRKTLGQ